MIENVIKQVHISLSSTRIYQIRYELLIFISYINKICEFSSNGLKFLFTILDKIFNISS
jgi:hypothetical protein